MKSFWESDTYKIVKAIRVMKGASGLVKEWKDAVVKAAEANKGPHADAIDVWVKYWQVRPFYTAAELVPIWPTLAVFLGITDRFKPIKHVKRLANELEFARLPHRDIEGKRYYAVERLGYWAMATTEHWTRELHDVQS